MKLKHLFFLSALTGLFFTACQKTQEVEPVNDTSEWQLTPDVPGYDNLKHINLEELREEFLDFRSSNQSATIYDRTRCNQEAGTSTLHIHPNSITVNYKAEGATPGHAFTLWLIYFNGDGGFGAAIGGGTLVGESGQLNFSGSLQENDPTNVIFGEPLEEADEAFFFFNARSHGQMHPECMPAQINTFNGGCNGDAPCDNICRDLYSTIPFGNPDNC